MSYLDYNTGVPATNDDPSNDQPSMLTNTQSSAAIWNIDHYGFQDPNGGIHQQTTFPGFASPATPVAAESSVSYPKAGVEDSTHPQYYFQTNQNTFPLSIIRSYGAFTTLASPGDITPYTKVNVNGIIPQANGLNFTTFTITLSTNAVASDNVAVLITSSNVNSFSYTFSYTTGVGTLVIRIGNSSPPVQEINFVVIQI